MSIIDKRFIVNLQGKDFVTYEGLLDTAHQKGLNGIKTDLVQLPNDRNGMQCIVKATATTKDGAIFEGYGDADPTNVNRLIAKHIIRMAETRAKARALRDLTNIGMTALEELDDQDQSVDRDKRESTKENKIDPSKADVLRKFAKSKNVDEKVICNYYHVNTVEDMTEFIWNQAMNYLKKK
ncbi:hypothetical protein CLPU_1c03670 [Gottschalkia purinilytica]|uniref:Uncharacterized protein n=1 Tax=Gottschalkia purinilytica TaxID=1503 RepID=A0A0L0WFD9_GOTPU|nr:hypothetical protein [Gottschalkia purinilytica]KNF10202.1 hypothetical protein CLPU_1c03670 [Gottschalkia purinilytica]